MPASSPSSSSNSSKTNVKRTRPSFVRSTGAVTKTPLLTALTHRALSWKCHPMIALPPEIQAKMGSVRVRPTLQSCKSQLATDTPLTIYRGHPALLPHGGHLCRLQSTLVACRIPRGRVHGSSSVPVFLYQPIPPFQSPSLADERQMPPRANPSAGMAQTTLTCPIPPAVGSGQGLSVCPSVPAPKGIASQCSTQG